MAVKKGGAASCGRGGLRPSGVCAGLQSAKPEALVERWWALRASGLIASCGRKRAEVRQGAAEL